MKNKRLIFVLGDVCVIHSFQPSVLLIGNGDFVIAKNEQLVLGEELAVTVRGEERGLERRSDAAQFLVQLADIPRRILVALVVDDTSQLRIFFGEVLHDAGYFLHPQLLGCFQPGVTGDDDVVCVNGDGVQEPVKIRRSTRIAAASGTKPP